MQLDLLGDDGLTYCPTNTLEQFTEARPFSEVWGEGRMLLALSMLAQIDNNPRWVEIGKRKIDRLLALTREKEGFRFLWKCRFRPGETVPVDADEPNGKFKDDSLARGNPVFSMIYAFTTEPSQRPHPDTRDIPQRSVGSFLGWMRANDGLNVVKTEQGPKLSGHSIMP